MSDINNVDWFTITPATPVTMRQGLFLVPLFAKLGITYIGASEIMKQFNYSATRNFVLRELPTKPVDAKFGLTIKYRVGNEVTRYKLWDDAEFVLSQVPLYNGETIRRNFCIECWNYEGEVDLENTDEIVVATGQKLIPTDYRDLSNFATATGTEATIAQLPLTVPSEGYFTNTQAWLDNPDDENQPVPTYTEIPSVAAPEAFDYIWLKSPSDGLYYKVFPVTVDGVATLQVGSTGYATPS